MACSIIYPESNGRPIAETQLHLDQLLRCLVILEDFGAPDPLFFAAADLFLYYEEGNPKACVAPDLFVVKGIPKLPLRDIYTLWEEKRPPCFVLEVTSPSTATEDKRKQAVYARLGVAEYFRYDPRPLVRHRRPALQGHRLGASGYEAIQAEACGWLVSEELKIRLVMENGRLELYDLATGRRLLDRHERLMAAETRAEAQAEAFRLAEARALAAEARLAEVEALLREQRPPPL